MDFCLASHRVLLRSHVKHALSMFSLHHMKILDIKWRKVECRLVAIQFDIDDLAHLREQPDP
jgi:hypothetical protein